MNYYFDMDGVLVQYDKSAYIGNAPLFMKKDMHYFRHLNPDIKMVEVINKLLDITKPISQEKQEDSIYILTSLTNQGSMFLEHYHDKISWLNEFIPTLDTSTHFIGCVSDKRDIITGLKMKSALSYFDVLIDDFNDNLQAWDKSHGTAVKYCNGINSSTSFAGLNLTTDMTAHDITEVLLNLKKGIIQNHESKLL